MFKALANWFKKLFNSPAVQEFEEWCIEVFTAERALVLTQLKAFAISAVTTASQTGLDSDQKRKQALLSITAQAQTAGIVCGASMIALALEMALQAVKGKDGQ